MLPDDIKARIIAIAQGNPGALRVTLDLYMACGAPIFDYFEEKRIFGSDVWLLYKDVCSESYELTAQALFDADRAVRALSTNRASSFYRAATEEAAS